jgi:hypothetical protein
MPVELLEAIKQQTGALTPQEKSQLGRYLLEQARMDQAAEAPTAVPPAEEEKRQKQLEWLKAHRQEYAGQYVALDGDRLIGHGQTIQEARLQARQNGVTQPFLVRLTAEDEVLFGGW